jgi:hypothetical protein
MPRVATTLVDDEAVPQRGDVMHFCLPTRRLLRTNGVDKDRESLFAP